MRSMHSSLCSLWRWTWSQHRANAYEFTTTATIMLTGVICMALWASAGGTYFVKSLTETHNIVLVAENVRDLLTFLVQDVAASPEPEAHPFWYIHHPNLLAKIFSLVMGRLGLGLEGQVGVMLLLNVAALGIVAAAFKRFSIAAALAAVLVAATSYGAFHFNAGDLCRGPLYLLLWCLLYALVSNPGLADWRRSLAVAVVCSFSILSDWGFALFVVGFAFCWACVSARSIPVRWTLAWIVIPCALALAIYAAAVIAAVGWDFFLFDIKVTYLGRLGVWRYDIQSAIEQYRQNNVLIWPSQSQGIDRIQQLIGALLVSPLLNTGPAWLLLLPVAVWAVVRAGSTLGGDPRIWLVAAAAVVLNVAGLMPFPVLVLVVLWIVVQMRHVRTETTVERLSALLLSVVTALLLPGAIFPGFTTGFMIASGRPPLPLLEMTAAALCVELFTEDAPKRPFWTPSLRLPFGMRVPALVPALAVVFALLLIAVVQSDPSFVGLPGKLAIGLAFVLIGASVLVLIEMAQLADAKGEADGLQALLRWRYAVFFAAATLLLANHTSAHPVILGRYSSGYAVLLAAVAMLTLAVVVLTLRPSLLRTFGQTGRRLLLRIPAAATSIAVSAPLILLALAAIGQGGWFALSVAARLPQPIPYADVLKSEKYRGKSFLTTSYEALVWEATHGWTYMPAGNPPKLDPISSRFRHLADWKNEAKYSRPDYFLCDNTGYSYVRPGTEWEKGASEPLVCAGRACTCQDVARVLQEKGHHIDKETEDYAIIKFNWPAR